MLIEQITFLEYDQFTYQINFMYKGQNLQTDNIARTTSKEDVTAMLQKIVSDFDVQRADQNYQSIKKQFEGQSVDI